MYVYNVYIFDDNRKFNINMETFVYKFLSRGKMLEINTSIVSLVFVISQI